MTDAPPQHYPIALTGYCPGCDEVFPIAYRDKQERTQRNQTAPCCGGTSWVPLETIVRKEKGGANADLPNHST